jgi:hypothetical protein
VDLTRCRSGKNSLQLNKRSTILQRREYYQMKHRSRASGEHRPPAPPWFAAAVIGLTIQTMASSAAVIGAGMALGKVIKPGS